MVISLGTFEVSKISLNFHISEIGPLITIIVYILTKLLLLLEQFLGKTLWKRKFLGKICKSYIIINLIENSI